MAHKSSPSAIAEISDVPEWLVEQAGEAEHVFQFCQRHNILEDLKTALELTNEAFGSASSIEVSLKKDPEAISEDLIIKVTVTGSVASFRRSYKKCVQDWCSLLPTGALALMGLSSDIL